MALDLCVFNCWITIKQNTLELSNRGHITLNKSGSFCLTYQASYARLVYPNRGPLL